MYITGIINYLIWPAFILVAWLIIWAALRYYDRKFPVNNHSLNEVSGKNDEASDAAM
jgi:hypothetical protein